MQLGEGRHGASIGQAGPLRITGGDPWSDEGGLPLPRAFAHTFRTFQPTGPPARHGLLRNIGIIGRLGSTQVLDTIRRLKTFLLQRGRNVILENTIAEVLPGHGLQTVSRKLMGEICDLVIVVGGDGSLLGAARALVRPRFRCWDQPRQAGFLTDIRPDELETKVAEVLDGQYLMETRFLLDPSSNAAAR